MQESLIKTALSTALSTAGRDEKWGKMLRQLTRIGILLCAALLLWLAAGCQSLTQTKEPLPQYDYAAAASYLVPTLKQHSAFGSDRFNFSAPDLRAGEAAAVADMLRRHGAAVCTVLTADQQKEGLQPVQPVKLTDDGKNNGMSAQAQTRVFGAVRDLTLKSSTQGRELLLQLSLDDLTFYCAFVDFEGHLTPSSALSIQRGTYGS